MTPLRQHSFIRQIKDITVSSTLAFLVLGNTALLQSCGSSEQDNEDYEEVEVYNKGVRTYISEVSRGDFKITKEESVPANNAVAIVTYLDGKKDTLSPRAVKALIDNEITTHRSSIGQSNNLSNALLFGGMGYLLAKTLSPSYSSFRPDMANNFTNYQDTDTNNPHRNRHHSSGILSRYFVSKKTYEQSRGIHEHINSSRTVSTRPTGGKSGFFRSSSHGGFHG